MPNSSERKLINSAIGSWSGYIYQGMCAVYVALDHIRKAYNSGGSTNQLEGYKLYLDAYDDFSVHNENGQAISLHQCKLYKQSKSFDEAQKLLVATKADLVQKSICTEDTTKYFHSNQQPRLIEGVSFFEDFEGDKSFNADILSLKISRIIAKIFEDQGIERHRMRVYNALISWVDTKVTAIHGLYLKEKRYLYEIATHPNSGIPFSEIISILFLDDFAAYPRKDFYRLLKYDFLHSIKDEIESSYESEDDWEGGDPKHIQILVDSIGNMPIVDFEHIVQRLLPVEHIRPCEKSKENVCNSSIAQELIQLVASCNFKLRPEVDWCERSKRQAPIAVKHLSLSKVCRQLYQNRANLDCLREYNTLVTKDGNEFITDIRDKVSTINQIDKSDSDENIFKTKKVGLLSVSKFNTGDYE